ncbi:hypothetical protein CN448_27565 [Bacillus cereus]|uniref:hypothetical protein n=1 Tax=Bacillus cereus TaxID=1396 RepID=UPI000BF7C053|nr:hypothetical protein [Bacillus cereus]PEW64328.1 hypothetical protein CN448_27565 [Bacillus cereus]
MKFEILSIHVRQDTIMMPPSENRYEAEINLKTNILGQSKIFKERVELPSILAHKVNLVFAEVQDYIEHMDTENKLEIFLDPFQEEGRIGIGIIKKGTKVDTVWFSKLDHNPHGNYVGHKVMQRIEKGIGWDSSSEQTLSISINEVGVGAAVADILRKYCEGRNIHIEDTNSIKG